MDQEFAFDENTSIVLHDSKGFEPGDNATFELAIWFLRERRAKQDVKRSTSCDTVRRHFGVFVSKLTLPRLCQRHHEDHGHGRRDAR